MSSVAENASRINELQAQFDAFLLGTLPVSSLSAAQRKEWENVIYPVINGFRARKGASNNDYSNWQAGDQIIEIDSANKLQIVGEVISTPFDPSTEIDDRAKFDLYKKDSPAPTI